MDLIHQLLAVFQDIPGHLAAWNAAYGVWIYGILFCILFAETGLVVTPFLPGDSLLFAVGAMTAVAGGLDLVTVLSLLWFAAVLGDTTNYSVGRWLGPRLFSASKSKIFNPKHLARTEAFFVKHGGRTLVMARFVPIIRTYAPFVAGLGKMPFLRFFTFSVSGGGLWIFCFVLVGRSFGNIPEIKSHFHLVIVAILILSLAPMAVEVFRARAARLSEGSANEPGASF